MDNKVVYNVGKKEFLEKLKKNAEELRLNEISEKELEKILRAVFTKCLAKNIVSENIITSIKGNTICVKSKRRKVAKLIFTFEEETCGYVLNEVLADEIVTKQIMKRFENHVFNCGEEELMSYLTIETGYKCSHNENRKNLSITLNDPAENIATIKVDYLKTTDEVVIFKEFNVFSKNKTRVERILNEAKKISNTVFLIELTDYLNKHGRTNVMSMVAGNMYDIYQRIPEYFPVFGNLSEDEKLLIMKNAYKKIIRSKDIYACSQKTFYKIYKDIYACSQKTFYQIYKEAPHILYTLNYEGKVYNKFFVREECGLPIWIGYTYDIGSGTDKLKESFMCVDLWLLFTGIK